MVKNESFEVGPLHYAALKAVDRAIDDADARRENVTKELLADLEYAVKHDNLVNITINGKPGDGKSTVGLQLMMDINGRWLKKRPGLQYIARDQTEFSRVVKEHPDWQHVCIVIDEYNELENTGFNATTEQAFLDYFSDIQAQRFLHRINCAPKEQADKNSYLILEVLTADKATYTTRVLVYYKLFRAGQEVNVLVGYADINVKRVMTTAWYKEYRRRKFEKMDLVTKEGIRSPRELEYADVVLQLVKELEPAARMGLTDKNTVKLVLRKHCVKQKIFLSILGERDILETVEALLKNIHKQHTLQGKLNALDRRVRENPSSNVIWEKDQLSEHYERLKKLHGETLDYWRKLIRLHEEYKRIDKEAV